MILRDSEKLGIFVCEEFLRTGSKYAMSLSKYTFSPSSRMISSLCRGIDDVSFHEHSMEDENECTNN